MKITLLPIAAVAVFTTSIAISAPPAEEGDLVKITEKRIPMDKRLLTLCAGPEAAVGPHAAAEVDVYVNEIVLHYRKENPNRFEYPVGSRFVKTKYSAIGAAEPDIATIMVKTGDTGEVTDWEFSMESLPDQEPIRPRARVSCASCHGRYEERGFISDVSERALRQHLRLPSKADPGAAPAAGPK